MGRIFSSLILITVFTTSCFKSGYLLIKLDNEDRAEALTEKGIDVYNKEIKKKGNYDNTRKIARYFKIALKYDPANKQAQQYLKLARTAKQRGAENYYNKARYYKKKQRKDTQDKFNMLFYLEKALKLNPRYEKARRLKKELKPVYRSLTDYYEKQGGKYYKLFKNTDKTASKEKYAIKAGKNYGRIRLISWDLQAGGRKDKVVSYMENRFNYKEKQIKADIKKHAFGKAAAGVTELYKFSTIDESFVKPCRDIDFQLKYTKAKYYHERGKEHAALGNVKAALQIYNNRKARKLKTKIAAAIYKVKQQKKREQKKAAAVSAVSSAASSVSADNDLTSIYSRAVSAYNNDNFNTAIKLFEKIN
ncbi:MAG TPA: hypothetical protein VKS21_05290, partial [Spirochaetota bacterium]|nr:hypothetical protein [Spirochaetota bacterium]